jgi:tetratricopeptide (TPR) repeat protein
VSGYLVKPLDIRALQHKLEILSNEAGSQKHQASVIKLETLVGEGRLAEARDLVKDLMQETKGETSSVALYGKALLARHKGDLQQAREAIDACLRLAPLMGRAWLLRARIMHDAGDMDQARTSVDKAMEISPDNVEYVLFRGRLELEEQHFPQSRQLFMTALNMAPGDASVRETIWNMHIKAGQALEAMQEFGPYLFEYLPLELLNQTALALRKQGETAVAVRVYRQALRKDPAHTGVLFNLAMAEIRLSDIRKGLMHLQRAVDLDPDFHAARKVLDRMKDGKGNSQ